MYRFYELKSVARRRYFLAFSISVPRIEYRYARHMFAEVTYSFDNFFFILVATSPDRV